MVQKWSGHVYAARPRHNSGYGWRKEKTACIRTIQHPTAYGHPDVIGVPRQLTDRSVRRRRNHAFVSHVLIGAKRRVLTVGCRNLCPGALVKRGQPTLPVVYRYPAAKPMVCLDVMSLVASSCGYDRSHIELCVARSLAVLWTFRRLFMYRPAHRQ
jgi:hypothetical protein